VNEWKREKKYGEERKKNRTEGKRTEQNRTEQNRTEQNRTEQNRTEQSVRGEVFAGLAVKHTSTVPHRDGPVLRTDEHLDLLAESTNLHTLESRGVWAGVRANSIGVGVHVHQFGGGDQPQVGGERLTSYLEERTFELDGPV
jgi:hypothetical protein